MTIKQQGGIFGRNPTFNDVDVDGDLNVSGSFSSTGGFSVTGTITVDGIVLDQTTNSISTGTSDGSDTARLFLNGGGSPSVNRGGNISVYGNEYSSIGGNVIVSAGDALTGGAVDGDIRFLTGPSRRRITIDENGDVFFYDSVGSTPKMTYDASAGNLLFTSGNGIDFSATSGTGTSELFDDYEEGTFTPELLFGGSNTGMTYVNQDGVYTKVGNVVHFQIYIRLSAKGSSTGNTSITGLPFATGFGYNVPAVWWTNMGTGMQPFIWAVGSSTTLIVQANNSGSSQNITNTSFTDTSRIVLSGTYRV